MGPLVFHFQSFSVFVRLSMLMKTRRILEIPGNLFQLSRRSGGFKLQRNTQHVSVTAGLEFDPDYSLPLECFVLI